jgi:internalin A
LDLSYNEISNGKPLQGLKKITVLNLSNNKISNINDLQGLTSLTSLNLTRNLISPENIEILKAFLPKCDIKF